MDGVERLHLFDLGLPRFFFAGRRQRCFQFKTKGTGRPNLYDFWRKPSKASRAFYFWGTSFRRPKITSRIYGGDNNFSVLGHPFFLKKTSPRLFLHRRGGRGQEPDSKSFFWGAHLRLLGRRHVMETPRAPLEIKLRIPEGYFLNELK